LEDAKRKLYTAETEMSNRDGLSDKKIAALEKKFQELRNQIDKLSNELHGKYSDNEYYN
jgi:chaperonin cofactor prefoldin